MQENGAGTTAVVDSFRVDIRLKGNASLISAFEVLAQRAIDACADWAAGSCDSSSMTNSGKLLTDALVKVKQMAHLIDTDCLSHELDAFVHTVGMAQYVAKKLRKDSSAPAATQPLIGNHPGVPSPSDRNPEI